ncbi:YkgJ family cysteine cluster protein [Desulfobotulus sp.]|jgi:Fe-S-cluster containining protein|uniref:YkgJ family cysteine cluster protein n=1 Tax=Desulfobotulus sp. TaxID=1940337 RepID=UPI002A35A125|nr:YkgJ family cysteine cluster protein [Desulfobotulus sp.]MDY0163691.1 YkgJ family cysteine cluster protein [Desulfobotulus sp.]
MEGLETGLAPEVLASFFSRIATLFDEMDRAYDAVTGEMGFTCTGCRDTCCETRFYHHTLIEVLYLLKGFSVLPEAERRVMEKKAEALCRAMEAHDEKGNTGLFRGLCPLNVEGRCRVYAHRPMICRLHGTPWKMQGRDGEVAGPGCAVFGDREDARLDRTPHYRALALLEQDLRKASGFAGRIRLSIAEILGLPMPEVGTEVSR